MDARFGSPSVRCEDSGMSKRGYSGHGWRHRNSVRALAVVATFAMTSAAIPPVGATAAPGGVQLQRIRGTVGYQRDSGSPVATVTDLATLPDDAIAFANCSSMAVLSFPAASISIGGSTKFDLLK